MRGRRVGRCHGWGPRGRLRPVPLSRYLVLLLWVPDAELIGPVVGLRHGFPEILGGAIVMSVAWVTAYLWVKLDGRTAPPARSVHIRFVAGLAVGMALALSSYGHVDRLYRDAFTYPREVVVVAARCTPAKATCVYHDELSTLDGKRLPLDMYEIVDGNRVGQVVTVRWDVLGYASPTSTTYPGGSQPDEGPAPSVPAWGFASIGALHVALTAYFSLLEYRRRRTGALVEGT